MIFLDDFIDHVNNVPFVVCGSIHFKATNYNNYCCEVFKLFENKILVYSNILSHQIYLNFNN